MKQFKIHLTLIFSAMYLCTSAQVKWEPREFEGKLLSYEVGYSFAYEHIRVEINGKESRFHFYPQYGQFMLNDFKVGSTLKFKALIRLDIIEDDVTHRKQSDAYYWFFNKQTIQEIWWKGEWKKFIESNEKPKKVTSTVFLEETIQSFYVRDEFRSAVKLDNGNVAFLGLIGRFFNPFKYYNVNDKFSFVGEEIVRGDGYAYPLSFTELFYAYEIVKSEGMLKSYLFKQNHVCIGVKFSSAKGDFAVSFPATHAAKVQKFLKPEEPLIIYHSAERGKGQPDDSMAPELHAIIQGKDTLYIEERGFFGGADGKHDHQWVYLEGKIKEIVRSDRGSIINFIVDNEFYIEFDSRFEKQIGSLLKRGLPIKISGEERIKKNGEVYKKNYRIVSPYKIEIGDKTYLLNQLP
ncbi:hypothetical protein SanaruYs_24580 [Chryseotalea sanaruensis]|uniref:Uncharacterized protein n=1 Tax=Chryseotalea sanaruensis TaxID=2482724 RepID=A0A401UBI1_9BACT|nr:hypothetical protein [Chryseotalea sanaruensis]GCC52222.1 hypothetical protein SanaruYs_24580 [Chryseotalea sanaruensis]